MESDNHAGVTHAQSQWQLWKPSSTSAYDPESACLLSLRHATGGHEQKSSRVEVAMEFSCRSRDSGDVLAS